MVSEFYAVDRIKLGLRSIHPDSRDWIYFIGMVIRKLSTPKTWKVFGYLEDVDHPET